jgi:hypothetical protein
MQIDSENSTWNPEGVGSSAPLAEQAKQQAGQVVQQTKEAASRVAGQAVEQVKSQLETGKERATGGLEDAAQALHAASQSMRDRNQDTLGYYAESGAELLENVSGYFRGRNVEQVLGDMEGFARRQTGLFLGGAFVAGFVLARFLKSSSVTGYSRHNGEENLYGRAAGAWAPSSAVYGRDVATVGTEIPPPATTSRMPDEQSGLGVDSDS